MLKSTQNRNNTLLLALEYDYLITLPNLTVSQSDRLGEILEIALENESLNELIEDIEDDLYLENSGLINN